MEYTIIKDVIMQTKISKRNNIYMYKMVYFQKNIKIKLLTSYYVIK